MEQVLLVMTNVPDANTAQSLARNLVERRLAACVNILPGVQSVYHWQGTIEEATELTLLIKTIRSHYTELENAIKNAHPYEVPEIISLPVDACSSDYLDWIVGAIKRDANV